MPQHNFVIEDGRGDVVLADISAALQALATISKGPSAPTTPLDGQLWLNSADDPWVLSIYLGATRGWQMLLAASPSTDAGVTIGGVGVNGTLLRVGAALSETWALPAVRLGGAGFVMGDSGVSAYWGANAYFNGSGWRYTADGLASSVAASGGLLIFQRAVAGGSGTALTWLESGRFDASGALGIGTTAPSTFATRLAVASAAAEGEVLSYVGKPGFGTSHHTYTCNTNGFNSATATANLMGQNSVTGRSLSTGGTVNTGGADYAEYEKKRPDCGSVAKGDIVGFDAAGLLTDQYDLAMTFGIKSTAPAYVGGDTWCDGALGARPSVAADADAEALATYATELAAWEAAFEAVRQTVDRIAYAGKVPLNHCDLSFAVGDLVIPARAEDGGIVPRFVSPGSATSDDMLSRVGRVRTTGADGRPVVVVTMG